MGDGAAKRAFFDEHAAAWDDGVRHEPAKLAAIVAHLGLAPGAAALDVGCGTGVAVPSLLAAVGAGGTVVALDFAPRMAAACRARLEPEARRRVRIVAGDASRLPFRVPFDGVLCYSCFPHFGDKRRAVAAMAAALKAGGRLVIAHGESRVAINALHRHGPAAVVGDVLPLAREVAAMAAAAGLEPAAVIDDDEMFVVAARKPAAER